MLARTIIFCPDEEINQTTVRDFLEQFTTLDAFKGVINIAICSDGGWMQGGMAIHDAIVNANNKVITTGLGTVSSAAVMVFQAGSERILSPNSSLFLHEVGMCSDGPMSHVERSTREGHRLQAVYNEVLAARSGLKPADIMNMCKQERTILPDEAIMLGLADSILGVPTPKKKAKK